MNWVWANKIPQLLINAMLQLNLKLNYKKKIAQFDSKNQLN